MIFKSYSSFKLIIITVGCLICMTNCVTLFTYKTGWNDCQKWHLSMSTGPQLETCLSYLVIICHWVKHWRMSFVAWCIRFWYHMQARTWLVSEPAALSCGEVRGQAVCSLHGRSLEEGVLPGDPTRLPGGSGVALGAPGCVSAIGLGAPGCTSGIGLGAPGWAGGGGRAWGVTLITPARGGMFYKDRQQEHQLNRRQEIHKHLQ